MKKKFVDNINNKPEDEVKGHKKSVKKTCKNVAFKNVVAVKDPEPAKAIDTGEDLYLLMNGQKLQFSSQISSIYDVKEYFLKTSFTQGSEIKFARKNGSDVPVHHSANCGFTLVGKAQNMFTSLKALCANGETSDDQEYVYINEHSVLEYSGKSGEHTLFVRVYDNLSGVNNDRWVVIYID